MKLNKNVCVAVFAAAFAVPAFAENPLISGAFSADPSAHVFDGRVYVFPSHDIPAPAGSRNKKGFNMPDYHVYSSENLFDWTDHGVIVDQEKVPWVDGKSYSMWAPDCNFKNGKYYFYFPAHQKDGRNAIGVAVADKPEGPYVPQEKPIPGVNGIDPCIFIDDDGTPYLTWQAPGNVLVVARLKDNMTELDSEVVTVNHNVPRNGLKEGPFMFKRNGKYYYSFPWCERQTECICYCMGDSPMGPFEYKGKIMEQNTDCWTNHHSVVEYKGQWYFFYHHNDYCREHDVNRSICAEYLTFNEDGTIQQIVPTQRGVGVTPATNKIQIDRYSAIGDPNHVWVEYNRTEDPFAGWKTVFRNKDNYRRPIWIEYDRVDFGEKDLTSAIVHVFARVGGSGVIEFHADAVDGELIARIPIVAKDEWQDASAEILKQLKGVHNLFVTMPDGVLMHVDWVQFK